MEGRENTGSVIATLLNRDGTLDEAATRLSETPADLSYILQVADAKEAVSVERPTFGARVRKGDQPGLLVAYNSFVPPYPQEWEGRLADPPADEVDPRYVNLVRLANSEEFYGKLNVDGMKRLMEVGIHQGGAMHDGTVHQVIAVPQELKLWIRGLGYSDWQQVDLKGLFKDS